jgi:transaldolase
MTRPKTKIFLDSGNPLDTKTALSLLGYLDGQTTNPSLISTSPKIQEQISRGRTLSESGLFNEYKKIIQDIKSNIPNGSISIEVYADLETKAEEMITQALIMNSWIDSAHIKLPSNSEGIKAAHELSKSNVNLNLTLCFTQSQAAAVYSATKTSGKSSVFVSPFIGRLDDKGLRGMDLIKNIDLMYKQSDHHVELLAASIRSINHFLYCLYLGIDIITAPMNILKEWVTLGCPTMDGAAEESLDYLSYLNYANLDGIYYEEIDLNQDFTSFNTGNELTEAGIKKFALDWNTLLGKTT